jgi:beta-1,2-rhamnosyltransferase WsaF-like protein
VRDANYRYVTFENAIKPMPWDRQTFHERHSNKEKKRLIIYARPESVGSRNDFALIILALKKALRQGCFDEPSWSFHGIGAMTPFSQVELTSQSYMEVIPKLPLQEYEEFLLQGDMGISVISTPHPGIIHFQMAAFGLTSITYAMGGRSPEWLRNQSKNLIPCHASIDGLCDGIAKAVQHSADINARFENAVHSNIPPNRVELEAAARFCASR